MNKARIFLLMQASVICGGCEILAPLLIAETAKSENPPPSFHSGTLSVQVESATGMVRGQPVRDDMWTPTGARFDDELTFRLASEGDLEIRVAARPESSSTNPYSAVPEDGGLLSEDHVSNVSVCDATGCTAADSFGIELVQTEHGRSAFIDGFWAGGEHIEVTLRYTEAH